MSSSVSWWTQLPERMNPVLFQIGGFRVQYYGLMYLAAFLTVYFLARLRIRREPRFSLTTEQLQNLMLALIIGVIAGGRLGYVLFYNLGFYWNHPLQIILPFDITNGWRFTGIAGMSFHGGLIGVIAASWISVRRQKLNYRDVVDLIVPCVPLGYTFGRIGNFINGELYGRVTRSAIGMVFPDAPGTALRHPSQLYEAFFEGVVLFLLLWWMKSRLRTPGTTLVAYLLGYGTLRFFIEYTRQPDAHLGFIFLRFSMGQLLCLGMILAGAVLYLVLRRLYRRESAAGD